MAKERHNPLAEVEEECKKEEEFKLIFVLPPNAELNHNIVKLTKHEALAFISSLAVQLSMAD